ncbi:MAG: imidazole glycerol phosphate synthase subunit HisH [Lentisphaerae bacterium]|nr:imidazole glycerol phosphate synthase subunit HisH [Lentisphaerota bacterium]
MRAMTAIIDYQAGNLTSVKLALDALGAASCITADPAVLRRADRLIFPGVGAAGAAMQTLRATGLDAVIRALAASGKPFLGICLGTQILFESSEEDNGVELLGLLPGRVVRFRPSDPRDKVPHMGWNQVLVARPHPLLAGIPDNSDFYFVHSFYPDPARPDDVLGTTDFAGLRFAAMVGRDNLAATQFHVEKSGPVGLQLLHNFLAWRPATPAPSTRPPC